ncbi:MAG: ParB/RepB/Spo0J family partition protein [bacterium]|nr:ParB/RepB/Spo0J family partition protein [bacterium]
MKTRKGLGKGLAALISEADTPAPAGAAPGDIALDLIDPNPFQPRQVFDDESLDDLTRSIQVQGILQPVLLRRNGERFQLIVGERRWRAARAAGLSAIPAQVRDSATDEEMLELALLENVQRKDLNPIEIAQAILRLQESCHLTQEMVAEKLGVSRAHVANLVRLLRLPERIKTALADGRVTMGHARALLSVSDEKQQSELFERFLADGRPTVREAEDLTRRAAAKPRKKPAPADHRQELELRKLEERLRRVLSTRVRIKARGRGGVLEIQFFSAADLQRILDLLEK